ncbi:hypothetical protein [Paenibacillus bovis]|uniref:Uncharacterized protein n=1 Tax=Paenibacillus bovis TaxID=1616788 RepID=A0A172ZB33_9BACL|nr:hypothetical protein [Paenibacillus bovis]ANF94855.1 hypothetical protein AR543_01615 [Paenibacillus bovis]
MQNVVAVSAQPHIPSVSSTCVGSLEIYLYDHQRLSLPDSCGMLHCGLLRISLADGSGWAEYEFSDGLRRLDLVRWASVFQRLKGLTVQQALEYVHVHRQNWGHTRAQLAIEALHNYMIRQSESADSLLYRQPLTERQFLSDYAQAYYSF